MLQKFYISWVIVDVDRFGGLFSSFYKDIRISQKLVSKKKNDGFKLVVLSDDNDT